MLSPDAYAILGHRAHTAEDGADRAFAHAGVELIPLKSIVDDAQQLERMAAGVVPAAARRP